MKGVLGSFGMQWRKNEEKIHYDAVCSIVVAEMERSLPLTCEFSVCGFAVEILRSIRTVSIIGFVVGARCYEEKNTGGD